MDQSIMRFADASARTSAIGTPTEGMVTYLDDVNQIEVYDGAAWVDQQAPILSEGTAGQYLQSNGTAGSQWVDLEIADDIITTEGDLIIGGASGVAQRLGIGGDGFVLTSNGTTATWEIGGGGGGAPVIYTLPSGFSQSEEVLDADIPYAFDFSGSTFEISVVDANGNFLENFSADSTVTLSAEAALIYFNNDTGSEQVVTRTNPVAAQTEISSISTTIISTTQSVTLTEETPVILIGGGGGGGAGDGNGNGGVGGGGGGSGFLTIGTLSAGTYTATIGAGGAGGAIEQDGSTGGTTSIGALSANGGGGGERGIAAGYSGGGGGDGGSGGGGGGSTDRSTTARGGGSGGGNGADGQEGGQYFTSAAPGGSGSGDQRDGFEFLFRETNYAGGNGGAANSENTGQNGTDGEGGNGGSVFIGQQSDAPGGNGGDGLIVLVTGV